MSLYTSARKCILTIDEGPFLCNCFLPGETGRGVLTPLDYPAAPGWDSVRGRRLFMLTPVLWAGGINGRMTLTLEQTGATYITWVINYPIRKVIDPL